MSHPDPIDLSFNYGVDQDLALFKLWKLTGDLNLLSFKMSLAERLNNRLWRLLNEKILLDKRQDGRASHATLDDLARESLTSSRPQNSQFLGHKPSLFLGNSKSTLFSHNSLAGLKGSNTSTSESMEYRKQVLASDSSDLDDSDDISDISEEDDFYLSEDDDASDGPEIAPVETERPSSASKSYFPQVLPEPEKPPLNRSRTSFVRGFSPSRVSISSANSNADTRKTSTTSSAAQLASSSRKPSHLHLVGDNRARTLLLLSQLLFQKQGPPKINTPTNKNIFYIANSPSPPGLANNPQVSPRTADQSTEEISNPDSKLQNLQRRPGLFDDYQIRSSEALIERRKSLNTSRNIESISKSDTESEWLSVSSESEQILTSPMPLKFDKKAPMSKVSSVSTDIIPTPNADRMSTPNIMRPKSLLSGLFLNEMASNYHSNKNQGPKPALQRSSTTGIITIDQDAPKRHNGLTGKIKRPSIIFSKKYTSLTDISKNYPHYQNNLVKKNILNDSSGGSLDPSGDSDDGGSLFAKQKSIVGVSDFNVTTKSASIKSKSSSIRSNPNTTSGASAEQDLSSSLSRYSKSASSNNLKARNDSTESQSSFKNLLSKSSLSLTSIFGQNKKYTPGKFRPTLRPGDSREPLRVTKPSPESDTSKVESIVTDGTVSTDPLPLSPSKQEPQASPIEAPMCPLVQAKIVKLSPKTTRRSMLSAELSNSLKESIIIDYKLGKVPLPSKVINSEELMKSHKAANLEPFEDDVDDYHSKGW